MKSLTKFYKSNYQSINEENNQWMNPLNKEEF